VPELQRAGVLDDPLHALTERWEGMVRVPRPSSVGTDDEPVLHRAEIWCVSLCYTGMKEGLP
jgi:hypothetical protein